MRGDCSNLSCGKTFKLRQDGNIPKHDTRQRAGLLGERERRAECGGSGKPPHLGRTYA